MAKEERSVGRLRRALRKVDRRKMKETRRKFGLPKMGMGAMPVRGPRGKDVRDPEPRTGKHECSFRRRQ